MPLSPLAYFGNREGLLDDITALIQQHQTPFECLYDLFSGSGSFSLQAMSLGLAKRYVVNDIYEPLTTFWQQVKDNPEKLIEAYSILRSNYLKAPDKKLFYEKQQESFNNPLTSDQIPRAACFAFVINQAEGGMPLINSAHNTLHLCCKWTPKNSDLAEIDEFSTAVRKTHKLFKKQQEIIFSSLDFNHYKEQITAKDLVILDPPYPDMPDAEESTSEHIYQRTEPKAVLQKSLQAMIEHLKEKNTPFLLFYGVLGLPNAYPIQYEENHYGRIAGGLNHPYGEYVENVYLSPHFAPFLQAPRILRYDNIVHTLIADKPYQAIAEAMKKKIETDSTWHKSFPLLFEEKASRYALKPALINHENQAIKLSYETLNQQINQLTHYLLSQKIYKGKLVALMLDNQVDYLKSMLAVWKTGAAYVPVSLTCQDKIGGGATQIVKQIFDKTRPDYIIISPSLTNFLPVSSQPTFVWSEELLIAHSKENPHTTKTIHPDDLAYVMCTSGSSGTPKAVAIAHRGLAYCLQAHRQELALNENDQIAQMAQFGFDASLMEIMMALGIGGALHLIPKPWIDDERQLQQCFNKHAINTAIFVPAKLKQLKPNDYPKLTKIIITGEGFDESLLKPWKPQERLLMNGYGLTETTICTTLVRYVEGELTIGAPIMGTEILLLDEHNQLIKEPNQLGEICVAGQSLAQGYYGDKELTEERFKTISHPLTQQPALVLRTGDMALYSATKPNELICQGRFDNQIKLRGQLVTLSHIESQLKTIEINNQNVIKDAFVVEGIAAGHKYLVAYLVGETSIYPYQIHEALIKKLPNFMVPQAIAWLDSVPLTTNGKVNRRNLAARSIPFVRYPSSGSLTSAEQTLAQLWIDVLGESPEIPIQREDDFFCLGGTSLHVSHLLKKLQEHSITFPYANQLTPTQLYQWSSLKTMARQASYLPLKKIHEGDSKNPSLYLVHSITGDGWTEYEAFTAELCKILPEQTIYAFRARGLDNDPSLDSTIEDMAADYVDNLLEIHAYNKNKPLIIGGWSTGGTIALEMSHQLTQRGYTVYLYVFDTLHPAMIQQLTLKQHAKHLKQLSDQLKKQLDSAAQNQLILTEIEELIYVDQIEKVFNLFEKTSKSNTSIFQNTLRLVKTLCLAEYQYGKKLASTPLKSVLNVSLLTAEDTQKGYAALTKNLGWPITVHLNPIPRCHHFDLLTQGLFIQACVKQIKAIHQQERVLALKDHFKQAYYPPQKVKSLFKKEWVLDTPNYIPVNLVKVTYHKISEPIKARENKPGITQKPIILLPDFINQEKQESIIQQETAIALSHLFTPPQDKQPQRLLLEGHAGSGKTLLVKYLLHAGSRGELGLGHFEAVIGLNLRQLPRYIEQTSIIDFTLAHFIHYEYFGPLLDKKKLTTINHFLKHTTSCLFIADGFDEVASYWEKKDDAVAMLLHDLLKQPYLFMTARPGYTKEFDKFFNKIIHNTGFKPFIKSSSAALAPANPVQQYIINFFAHEPEKNKTLKQFLEQNPLICTIIHTPIILELLCGLWENNHLQVINEHGLFSYTKLYTQFYDHLVRHYSEHGQGNKQFKEAVNQCLKRAAFLAVKSNSRGIIPGTLWQEAYQDITAKIDDEFEQALAKYSNPYLQNCLKASKLGRKDWFIAVKNSGFLNQISNKTPLESNDYEFLHLSLQDFFAAHFMKEQLMANSTDADILNLIAKHRYNPRYESVWAFIAGLLASEKQFTVLTHYFTHLTEKPHDMLGIGHACLLVRCLEETSHPQEVLDNQASLIQELKAFIEPELLIKYPSIKLLQALKSSPLTCKSLNLPLTLAASFSQEIQKGITEASGTDIICEGKDLQTELDTRDRVEFIRQLTHKIPLSASDVMQRIERLVQKNAVMWLEKAELYWYEENNIIKLPLSPLSKTSTLKSETLITSEIYSHKAWLFFVSEQYQRAHQYFEQGLKANPQNINALSGKGLILHKQGQHEQALKCYDQALTINPKHFIALHNKGVALAALEQHAQALKCYDQALAINPKNHVTLSNKGNALLNLGQHAQTLICYDQALALNPNHADNVGNKGTALLNSGQHAQALICYDQALAINPKNHVTLSNKGNALLNLGQHAQALICYDQALAINPKNADILGNKGTALRNLGQHAQALKCLDQALALNPKHAASLGNKGNVLLNLGQHAQAIKCYDQALALNPKNVAILGNKGNVLLNLGQHAQALKCFDQALAINPKNVAILGNKGTALLNLGQHEQALKCFDQALAINPKNVAILGNKGNALLNLGQHEQALKCFDQALAINPKNDTILGKKGIALEVLGQHEQAIKYYDQALAINPKNDTILGNKGNALLNLGQQAKALKYYDQALAINPKNDTILGNKGSALGRVGQYEQAIKYFDQALAINPKNDIILSNKGNGLAELGKHEQALKCYDQALALNPNHANNLCQKGNLFLFQGQYESAKKYYNQALEIDSYNINVLCYKGLNFLFQKNYKLALFIFENILDLAFKNKNLLSILKTGICFLNFARKQTSESVNLLIQLRQMPFSSKNLLQRICLIQSIGFHTLGEAEKALDCVNFYLQNNPTCIPVLLQKSRIYLEQEDYQEAEKCFELALSYDPNNETILQYLQANIYNKESNKLLTINEELPHNKQEHTHEQIFDEDFNNKLDALMDKLLDPHLDINPVEEEINPSQQVKSKKATRAPTNVAPNSFFYKHDSISKHSKNIDNATHLTASLSSQSMANPILKKGLKNEKHFMAVLQQFIPLGMILGKAHDQGDCFFDALAQCINKINSTDINNDKYLRILCHDYYGKNKAIVDKLNARDYGGIDKRDDYSMVQYTADECRKHFHDRSPIWGRPAIEGIILCNQLNLRGFCVIEILEHPETKQPIPSFHWVNKETYTSISESEAREKLNNPEIPTLVVEQNSLHFVPLVASGSSTLDLSAVFSK